jgi:surfactin synthase thioesterase subunit
VQFPGREERAAEPTIASWPDLVAPLASALAAMLDRAFVFYGHSLGAVVSFEVARWLRRHRGIGPSRLLVSGRRAPHLPDHDPSMWDASDEEMITRLRELRGTPPEILGNPELFALIAPRLRADFRLADTYRYEADEPLACPITAFGGTDDPECRDERLDGWSQHTCGGFTKFVLDGDHFFLHSREHELLALIRRELLRTPPRLATC